MATDLTRAMLLTLKRMPIGGWVHAKRVTGYLDVRLSTVRGLVKRGMLSERPAQGNPDFDVKITDAGLDARGRERTFESADDAYRCGRCGVGSHAADLYSMDDDVAWVDCFTMAEKNEAGHSPFL